VDFGNGRSADNVVLAFSQGTSGQVSLHIYRGASVMSLTAPVALPLNRWTHVAATLQATTGTLYLDGALVARGTLHQPSGVNRTSNFIGRSNWGLDQYASAVLDDVRLWSEAISADVIRQWKDQPNLIGHPQGATLQAQWRFDETSGVNAEDSSGSGRTDPGSTT
jgi:hypothetical protein